MHKLSKLFTITLLTALANQQIAFAQPQQDYNDSRQSNYDEARYRDMNYGHPDFDRYRDAAMPHHYSSRDNSSDYHRYDYHNDYEPRGMHSDQRTIYRDREAGYYDREKPKYDRYYYEPRFREDYRYHDYDRGYYDDQEYYHPRHDYRDNFGISPRYDYHGCGRRDHEYRDRYIEQRDFTENASKHQIKREESDTENVEKSNDQRKEESGRKSSILPSPGSEQAMLDKVTTQEETSTKATTQKEALANETLGEIINHTSSLSTFAQLIKAAGINQALSKQEQFTIFAPNNQALQKNSDQIQNLLKPENKQKLIDFLKNHIVANRVSPETLKASAKLNTLSGKELGINVSGKKITVNQANVVESEIKATNGVIYVIDAVLAP